jgi:hypothetical protein
MSYVFADLPETVAKTLDDEVGNVFRDVGACDGPATLVELLRQARRLPALLVTTPSDVTVAKSHVKPLRVDFEAYVIVPGTSTAKRGRASLALAGEVRNAVVSAPEWGASERPQDVRRTSLYSVALDDENVAIQVITWSQDFTPQKLTAGELQDLLGVDVVVAIENPGAGDPDPLPSVGDDVDVEQ